MTSSVPSMLAMSQLHTQLLSSRHIPHMLRLQDTVLNYLPPEKKNYIVPKTAQDFGHFAAGPYHALGVFCKNQLVAQTLIAIVQPHDTNKNLTLCDAVQPIIQADTPYAVIEGVLVDPAYRLHGVMSTMVSEAVTLLKTDYDCTRIYSEIAEENIASIRGFLKNAFECIGHGTDPSDGCKLSFMQYTTPHTQRSVDNMMFK